jgi:flagellar biosynthesis protein FlhF
VRQAFGKDAVVMSTRPCPEGVEVLAMAPESLQHLEKLAPAARGRRAAAQRAPCCTAGARRAPTARSTRTSNSWR